MKRKDYVWIMAIISLLLLSSCSNSVQQMGMMHNTGNRGQKLVSLDRSIEDLSKAEESQTVEIKDGETYQIKAKQGSTIYVDFKNSMEFETTIHWHGLRHDFKFDGVEEISQDPVNPGES